MPRVQVAINLYTYSVLGIFLVAVPWTPMWAQATLLLGTEAFGSWAQSGWVRGAVSGLGALDLLVAAQEAGVLWRSFQE